jgi:hypothetical protein
MQASDVVAWAALAIGLFNLGVYLRERRALRRLSGNVTLSGRYRTAAEQRWDLLEAGVTVRNSTHHVVCLNHALITSPSGHGVILDDLFGLPHELPPDGSATCTVPADRLAAFDTFQDPSSHVEAVIELTHGRHRLTWHSNPIERRPRPRTEADA